MPAPKKPLWTCPDCGHQFVTRNIWHSCINYPLEKHFEGKPPEVIALYQHYLGLVKKIGPVNVEPKKTGISFLVRVRFAGAVLRKKWLEARLWLKHPVEHPCLRRIEKVGARDFIHYFRIQSVDEMDGAFIGFLRESYAIGIQEDFMEGQEFSLVKATEKEIKETLSLLAETPGRIAHLTKSIEEARLQERQANQWSINEILAHLRSCADVWGDSIDAMLAENFPTLLDIHPRKWIKETNYLKLPFPESFQAFIRQRERLLITLKKLSFEDWSRAAMIAGRKHTVFTQARRMAKHEKEHCEQIESLLQRVSQR